MKYLTKQTCTSNVSTAHVVSVVCRRTFFYAQFINYSMFSYNRLILNTL